MTWHALSDQIPQTPDELITILAKNRGITEVAEFLSPTHPLELTLQDVGIEPAQMVTLIEILEKAHADQTPLIVFGDYDADGISATAILWQTLHKLGFDAKPFIPDREKHGYGLSTLAIEDLEKQNLVGKTATAAPIIITVDNGIVAHEPIKQLNKLGATVIITDHHVAEETLPPAAAIVHTTQLCGSSVSWMVAREVSAAMGQPITDEWWQLDLAGLATIADQVPLLNANRAFAWWGIKALQHVTRPGLLALYRQAAVEPTSTDESTINYVLAPRINAMGRLAQGIEALRLLCTSNQNRAILLAEKINDINSQRQKLTEELVRIALSQQSTWQDEQLIIVASPAYHEGVIGLVAGKLAEQFHKPAIVIAVGEAKAKASARSIPGIDVIAFLREHRHLFTELGGHPMAAGFGIKSADIATATVELLAAAKEKMPRSDGGEQAYDCELIKVDAETISVLKQFQPYGQGNLRPLFLIRNLQIQSSSLLGKEQQHLKIIASHTAISDSVEILAWHRASLRPQEGQVQLQIVTMIEEKVWRRKVSLQLTAKNLEYLDALI